MIAQLSGEIVQIQADRAVIDVNGVGYWFFASATTLASLRHGANTTVHTQMVVREDSITLYGFSDLSSSQCFEKLIGVSGIGPKLALAALSVFTAEELASAVANNDFKAITAIPGVGKKVAQRLVVEIGDKLGSGLVSTAGAGANAVVVRSTEVVQALEQLGWKSAAAAEAVQTAEQANPDADVAQLLRASLQILGGKRG